MEYRVFATINYTHSKPLTTTELKDFLDQKVIEFNKPEFIESDPIQIPHLYTQKEDIEIAGFLAATIAWGKREMIIKNSHRMMELMGNAPYDYVMNHQPHHLDHLEGFVHRTFNSVDFAYFIKALKHIYTNHKGLENIFNQHQSNASLQPAIHQLKQSFFEIEHPTRTTKHVSDPLKGSAAKRLNM